MRATECIATIHMGMTSPLSNNLPEQCVVVGIPASYSMLKLHAWMKSHHQVNSLCEHFPLGEVSPPQHLSQCWHHKMAQNQTQAFSCHHDELLDLDWMRNSTRLSMLATNSFMTGLRMLHLPSCGCIRWLAMSLTMALAKWAGHLLQYLPLMMWLSLMGIQYSIMNDWLSGIQANVQDNNPEVKENTALMQRVTQHHHRMTKRMKHWILWANAATTQTELWDHISYDTNGGQDMMIL